MILLCVRCTQFQRTLHALCANWQTTLNRFTSISFCLLSVGDQLNVSEVIFSKLTRMHFVAVCSDDVGKQANQQVIYSHLNWLYLSFAPNQFGNCSWDIKLIKSILVKCVYPAMKRRIQLVALKWCTRLLVSLHQKRLQTAESAQSGHYSLYQTDRRCGF